MSCKCGCEVLYKRTYKISEDTPLVLPKGQFAWKILVKSPTAQTIEIGTTSGGDEILLSTLLTANVWLSITQDVLPVGSNTVIIYISGITAYTEVIVYKLKL